MTGIEIVLLLSGGLIFTLSFLLPSSSNDESTDSEITTQGSEKLNRTLDRMMDAKETEIRHRVREIADDEAVEAGNSTKRNLERITNEKIMAVDEYSKTELDAIEKNHQEVIFLYDMLNNKSVDLKNTIRKAEQTKKEVEAERAAEEQRAAQVVQAARALRVAEDKNKADVEASKQLFNAMESAAESNRVHKEPMTQATPIVERIKKLKEEQTAASEKPAAKRTEAIMPSPAEIESGFLSNGQLKPAPQKPVAPVRPAVASQAVRTTAQGVRPASQVAASQVSKPAAAAKPATTAVKTASTAAKPAATTARPAATGARPAAATKTTAATATTAAKPATAAVKTASTAKPAATAVKTAATAKTAPVATRPASATTARPAATAAKPAAAATRPAATAARTVQTAQQATAKQVQTIKSASGAAARTAATATTAKAGQVVRTAAAVKSENKSNTSKEAELERMLAELSNSSATRKSMDRLRTKNEQSAATKVEAKPAVKTVAKPKTDELEIPEIDLSKTEPLAMEEPLVIDEIVSIEEPVIDNDKISIDDPVLIDEPVFLENPFENVKKVAKEETPIKPAFEIKAVREALPSEVEEPEETMVEYEEPIEASEPVRDDVPNMRIVLEEQAKSAPVTISNSGLSRNEQVLAMHHEGKTNIEIAKALAMGVGEVKLVVGLYDKENKGAKV